MYRTLLNKADLRLVKVYYILSLIAIKTFCSVITAELIGIIFSTTTIYRLTITQHLIILVILGLLEIVLQYIVFNILEKQKQHSRNHLYKEATQIVNSAVYSDIIKYSDSDLYHRIVDSGNRANELLFTTLVGLFSTFCCAAVAAGYLFLKHWSLATIYLLCEFANVYLQYKLSKPAEKHMNSVFEAEAMVGAEIQKQYACLPLIQVFSFENNAYLKLNSRIHEYIKMCSNAWSKRSLLIIPLTLLSYLPSLLMLFLSSYLVSAQIIQLADFLSILIILLTMNLDDSKLPVQLLEFRQNSAAAKRYLQLFMLQPEIIADTPAKEDENVIVMNDVSYNVNNSCILHNISLSIKKGSITALVGKSGSGKSTLIKLMSGIIEPSQGDIYVFHTNPARSSFCRKNTRVVLQQGVPLFHESILKNIQYGNAEVSSDEIASVCKLACLDFYNPEQPHSADEAIKLSGGQKRRVELARALIGRGKLYLFDELTSEWDRDLKQRIITRLKRKHKTQTIVYVTHELDEAFLADWIYVVENGTIIYQGNPQVLKAKGILSSYPHQNDC